MVEIKAKFSQDDYFLGNIGFAGEGKARTIVFDCTDALTEFPNATIAVAIKRPNDTDAYLATVTASGNNRSIVLQDADMAQEGRVAFEVRALDANGLVYKSVTYLGVVKKGLRGSGETPTNPFTDMLNRLTVQTEAAEAFFPTAGTGAVGNVLKKTATGTEWGEGGGGGTDTNAVHYTAETKTAEQKAQARTNIGAGTSNFSGAYADLSGKPTIPDELKDLSDDATHRLVTDTEKAGWNAKYDKPSGGIPASDMAAAVRTSLGKADSALQSVPNTYRTAAEQDAIHDSTKQDVITDLATIRSGAALGATAVQPETGKGLFSGSYTDLTDKPSIPTKTSDLTNDSGFLTQHQSLAAYRTAAEQDAIHDSTKQDVITDLATIRSGAALGATAVQPETGKGLFSGSYTDLTDKPSIPTKTSDLTNDSGFLTQHQDISGKADKITVTAADNGKFMRVVNGAWAAVTVPDANGVSF